ncbi:MAG: hypothetical protein Kow0089_07840 [Desulfobulbaceae bacterium]
MRTYAIALLAILVSAVSAEALTMEDLFAALTTHPASKLDTLQTQEAELGVQGVHDRFYPTLTGILSYQEYNSPTNLRPVTPTETAQRQANGEPLPFSETIGRIGAHVTMPIFIKELFSLGKKASLLSESARVKQRLNLLQREAVLISANGELKHLEQLRLALEARKGSLAKTRDDVQLQVNEGRAPRVELVRMDEAITKIDLALNGAEQQVAQLKNTIEELTGIHLDTALPMSNVGDITPGPFFALQPLEKAIQADEYGLQAARDKLYPRIVASGDWFNNYGEGYNNGEDLDLEYGNFAITLQVPLFDKSSYTGITRARVELHRDKMRYQKTKIELEAREKSLRRTLGLLASSLELGKKSVAHQEQLLEVAKIAFRQRRMLQEEYLRYEENLLQAQANYYQTRARWWQNFATMAVLYGNDLQELVK